MAYRLLSRELLLNRTVRDDPDTPNNATMAAMIRKRIAEFERITNRLASGKIAPAQWAELSNAVLLEGHVSAARQGRILAGSDNQGFDLALGKMVADDQSFYLSNFLDAIEAKDPRYFDEDGALRVDRVNRRLASYTGRMRGTGNEAFLQQSPKTAEFRWVLGRAEDHCTECPEFASMGALLRDDFPTVPGANDTPCLYNCSCTLVRTDGVSGFGPV